MTMRSGRSPTVILAALALLGAHGVQGQEPKRLEDVLTEAVARNPRILAATKAAEAAAARVSQTGALPDPVLGVGVMNVPVRDPSLGRDMMTMTTVQLAEQLPWPGKRALREDVARLTAEAAEWEVERTRQAVLADVQAAWYGIYFLDRALDVTERNEALVGDLAQLTSARYGVGTGAQPDVLKAQVERTRLTEQHVALAEQRESAVARLNALLGRATDTPVPSPELPHAVRIAALGEGKAVRGRFASAALDGVVSGTSQAPAPGVPTVVELQRRALENNPMIQAHVRRVAAQERSLALAGKARLPDLNVSMAYSHRPDFGDFMNVMVSVPLPVFSDRKQDQAVVQEEATLAEHRARHDDMVNHVNAEIASLAAGLQRARDQLVLLDQGILPQARTGLSSATASYQVGRVDFLTLLDAQVTLYKLELDYHRLLSDFASDLAKLERAVGTQVTR